MSGPFFGAFILAMATGSLILGVIDSSLGGHWWWWAVVLLFYTKGTLAVLIYIRSKSTRRSASLLLAREWVVHAVGCWLTAALFVISGVRGEAWFGFIGAPVYVSLGLAFLLGARHAG